MARKRYGEDDILRLIREVEVHCNSGMDVVSACRASGVSDKTYYGWRRKYGGMNRARLTEMKTLEKEANRAIKKLKTQISKVTSERDHYKTAFTQMYKEKKARDEKAI